MPNFRRYYIPDSIVFITQNTRDRIRYLGSEKNIQLYWATLQKVQEIIPFWLLAYVILPDHFHWLMRIENPKDNFSKVLHSLKRNYTMNFKKEYGISTSISLWQPRFWDHIIRDENDLQKHVDYIHWNPIKHGAVEQMEDWPHSSYHDWLERGYYTEDWESEPPHITNMNFE